MNKKLKNNFLNLKLNPILLIILILIFQTNSNSNINKIITKVDNEIITTIDIFDEINYLSIINKNFSDIPKNEQIEISKKSLIKEKIKKIELLRNFGEVNLKDDYKSGIIKDFYIRLGFSDKAKFKSFLLNNQVSLSYIENKIIIETLWNQLIVKKFYNKVKIDENRIKEEVLKNNYQKEYLISEILFSLNEGENINDKYEKIKNSINNSNFSNAALLFSISDSSKNGGKIGWVKKSVLNKVIQESISSIEIGSFTNPIILPGGLLILKLHDIREIKEEENVDKRLKSLINEKTNQQLNDFSNIYFNKVKKNIKINEI